MYSKEKGESRLILKKIEDGITTYKTIVDAVIYPDKFIITFQNGKIIPYSAENGIIYEVLDNEKSLGILKKKEFNEFTKEEMYEMYHGETGKRAAYPRKKEGSNDPYLTETRKYVEWERLKNGKS